MIGRSDLTATRLTEELKRLISPDEPYRKNARHLSQMMISKPFQARDRVVQFTEHAIRFNISENLDMMYSRKLNVFEYYGLDVYTLLFFVFFLLVSVLYLMIRAVFRRIITLLTYSVIKPKPLHAKTNKLE